MLEEEFQELIVLMENRERGVIVPFDEVASRTRTFLNQLEAASQSAQPEAVKELESASLQMLEKIRLELHHICTKLKTSEEDLALNCQNRANFGFEEWQLLEQMEQKAVQVGKEIQKKLYPYVSRLKRERPHAKGHKPKKGEWLRP
jgi:hypothetical protein